ncbi:hypothetical protein RF11_02979 [Thelohanellus kitauei]|uniref:Uncharacterized protein n=1 Tax=Thelohanellus kitauei TaxID=669202 RepID=A0A0C2J175_THEKT|nr:hypothetical protein RF11_02979 [Thelohanellus kitauei]
MVNYSKPQNTMIPRTCTIDDDFVYSPQATNKVMIRYVEEPNFCTNPGSHNCSPREITDLQASSTRNAHAMGVVSHQLPNSHLNCNLNSPPCGITQYSDEHSANSVFDSRNENPERMGYSSKNDSERQLNIDTYCHGRARQHPQIRPSGINYSPIPHIDAAIQASQKHVCGQNQIPNTQSEWETGVQQRSDCSVGYTIKSNHGAIPSINNDHCTNNVYCSNAQIDCSQTDGIGCKKVRIEERSSMNGILDYTRHTESDTTSWHHRDHQPGVSFSPKDNELRLPIFSSLVNALSESDGIWPYTANGISFFISDRETREALGITLAPDVIAHMVKYYAIRNQPLEEDIYSISSKYSVSADKIKSWFEIQNKYDNEARDSSNRARCI